MPEQIQKIYNIVLEWWNKFTSRQKTWLVAIAGGIIMTLAILLTLLSQTQYVHLINADDAREASEISELLDSAGIKYNLSTSTLQFEVDKKQEAQATMLLASNNIQTDFLSIDDVTAGGFSVTEADKQRRYKDFQEKQIARLAKAQTGVKDAYIKLNIPYNDGTLLARHQESSAFIQLELTGNDFGEEQAAAFAKGISVSLGSDTPVKIHIIDTNGNVLFSGDDLSSTGGSVSNQLSTKSKAEQVVNNEVRRVLQNTGLFDNIVASSNIPIDFSSTSIVDNEYSVPPDRDEGFIAHEYRYDRESVNTGGGPPGTDSNTEGGPSYQYQDNRFSSDTESELTIDRLVNQRITESNLPPGQPVFKDASIAVTATTFNVIREEDARRRGDLDGISWEEFKDANSDKAIIPINDELISLISHASGVPLDSITFLAYQENIFRDADRMQVSWTDATQIILIVIILGLLAFVVIRSMRAARAEEEEEELSVERLLQSQPELEDISIDEGSEAKKIIDKFVIENPEAAAALLRNWLNEDWG